MLCYSKDTLFHENFVKIHVHDVRHAFDCIVHCYSRFHALLSAVLQMLLIIRNSSVLQYYLPFCHQMPWNRSLVLLSTVVWSLYAPGCLMKIPTAVFHTKVKGTNGRMFLSLWNNFILNTRHLLGVGRCGLYKPLLVSPSDLGILSLKWDLSLG